MGYANYHGVVVLCIAPVVALVCNNKFCNFLNYLKEMNNLFYITLLHDKKDLKSGLQISFLGNLDFLN